MSLLVQAGSVGLVSPFDKIRRVRTDGTEYWLAREMMEPLGYEQWRRMLDAVERAKISCNSMGHNVSDHFANAGKMIGVGKGAKRQVIDVELTRYACSLVAMNGDPRKPEVAAAQQYFAIRTRQAELAESSVVPLSSRPWSERLAATVQPHLLDVEANHQGCFTVVSAFATQMLILEDVLLRHAFSISQGDRPDISIAAHWSHERKARGLHPARRASLLNLPDLGFPVRVLVYDNSEFFACKRWFRDDYLPNLFGKYLARKPEFKPHGKLSCASVAENTCLTLTGGHASLTRSMREQLNQVGGFAPAGFTTKQLSSPQMMLFGS